MADLILSFETGGILDNPIGDIAGDEYGEAQSFQLTGDSSVGSVAIYIKKAGITDPITLRIETNAAGPKPSGTLVDANATTTISTTNTSYEWVTATFPASFNLTASTRYWIVCTVPAQSSYVRYDWLQNNGGGYADGGNSVNFNGGGWGNESATLDNYFRIYAADAVTSNLSTSYFID
jgi:hypothetical protein